VDESKEYVVLAEKGMDASLEFLEKLGTFDKQLSSVLRSLRNDTAALLAENKKKDDVISSLMADLSNRQTQLQEVETRLKEIEAKEAQQKEAAAAELNAVDAEISTLQVESPIRVYRLLTGSSETSTFANTVSVEVAEVKAAPEIKAPEIKAPEIKAPEIKVELEAKAAESEVKAVVEEVKVEAKTEVKAETETKTDIKKETNAEVKVAEPEAPTVKEVKPCGGFCCRR
jgi:hypothetical protein